MMPLLKNPSKSQRQTRNLDYEKNIDKRCSFGCTRPRVSDFPGLSSSLSATRFQDAK